MFVVKRHESLYGKKGNAKVLAGGFDVVMKDLCINIRAGGIVLFKFLHHGIVDDITRYFDGFGIGIQRGTDNNVCQNSKFKHVMMMSLTLIPRSRTKIRGTLLAIGTVLVCCLP